MTTLNLPERYKLVEKQYGSAPLLPTDRPPTKAEVWAFWSHVYDGVKTTAELKTEAKHDWAFKYATWWLRHGWRKQPDWVEGDTVIPEAVPHFIDNSNYQRVINQAWERARERKSA